MNLCLSGIKMVKFYLGHFYKFQKFNGNLVVQCERWFCIQSDDTREMLMVVDVSEHAVSITR